MCSKAILEKKEISNASYGIEFVWQLEDYFEQKDINKFLSCISPDYKKDFNNFKKRLENNFKEHDKLNLFVHMRSKILDLDSDTTTYEICWSKHFRKHNSIFLEKRSGRSSIVLRKSNNGCFDSFQLYDILGENPFI